MYSQASIHTVHSTKTTTSQQANPLLRYFSKLACSDYHRLPPRTSRCVAPESQMKHTHYCPLHTEYVTSPGVENQTPKVLRAQAAADVLRKRLALLMYRFLIAMLLAGQATPSMKGGYWSSSTLLSEDRQLC